jgi:DNA-binding XRE family transcriptional regulator
VPTIAAKKKSKHVIAWVREQLALTQSQLANLIDASQHTVQAIELGKLPLSEHFAYQLGEQTGIHPKWFLANKLGNPPPDPVEMRKHFEQAQIGSWLGITTAHFLPRMILLRFFVELDTIAMELGYSGCRATGFFKILQNMGLKLLECVPDKKVARRLHQTAVQIVKRGEDEVIGQGDDRVLKYWRTKIREIEQVRKKSQATNQAVAS